MSFTVKDVYDNRSILVTGATGFLGKVIVEKILWSLTDVQKVYLLIRPSKGHQPKQRLEKILQDKLFERVRTTKPESFDKLIAISGNLMEDNLGLNQHDMQTLCDEVSIVIHSAATVKFDEQLKDAVEMNVCGTTRLVALCHKMKQIIALVHVSTAYANCDLPETEEKIYDTPICPQNLMETMKWMDSDLINMITPKLLGTRPNTYTLTKALAEKQLKDDAGQLPVIVIRPSIVGAMHGAPLPGWTDNINGPSGIFAGVGKGVLTNMLGSNDAKSDIVPVDIVANTIIVGAAYRASIKTSEIPVVHCVSGDLNPLKWKKIVVYLEQFYKIYPTEQCAGVPSTYLHKHRLFFVFNFYYKHYIPAMVVDFFNGLIGRKKHAVKIYDRVWKMLETLHYFTSHGWTFHSKAIPQIWAKMTPEDQKEFNFDIRQINWDSYLFDYIMGIKQYILRDKRENLPLARSNLRNLVIKKTVVQGLVWYFLLRKVGPAKKKLQRFLIWAVAFMTTYLFSNYSFRSRVHMKKLTNKSTFC